MNEYETEEQQVAALKQWWKENGTSLIVGLFVGITALFGWRYYAEQNNAQAIQASDMYIQVLQNVTASSRANKSVDEKAIDLSNQLINNYADTPYAALASLALAKAEYENDNIEVATMQLQLAVKHANNDAVKQIANLRLSRIYIEQKKYDEAAAILNMSHDAVLDAQYEELKGDLYLAKGDSAQARTAYDKALDLQGDSASKLLKLKRQNLGAALSADTHLGSNAVLSNLFGSTHKSTNESNIYMNL